MCQLRILLVEDELKLAEALEYILKKNKFLVDLCDNGLDAEDMAGTDIYDLIILDRMLPGKEGVEILKSLRKKGIKTPTIFLTAKDSVECRVEGLDAGADDYLVKPFSTDELMARVRALTRRYENLNINNILTVGNLSLDTLACEAACDDKKIKLTVKEAQLLELLMRNFNQILTKEQILMRIWGAESDVEISNVELYIYYLRKKINTKNCSAQISTVRGIGYCIKEG